MNQACDKAAWPPSCLNRNRHAGFPPVNNSVVSSRECEKLKKHVETSHEIAKQV